MNTYRDPYTKLNIKTTVALGCFDGVHTAHARVISEAVRIARHNGTRSCVWCFSEPPKNAFLRVPVPLITSPEQKARLIRRLGADVLIMPEFTREISALSAEGFVRELLFGCAGAVHLVSGKNYSFGSGGAGNSEMLKDLCASLGIEYTVVDDVTVDGVGVSSTIIRDAVSSGQCLYASRLLGRSYSLEAVRMADGSFSADGKYLLPAEGYYDAAIASDPKKKPARVFVRRTESGCSILLGANTDAQNITLEFISNRTKKA